ncbi:hypothetical protein [Gordonia sp. SND2]|uniref:hypothetical protein n=1 Tax=Gordonia sp. SND2 TaxID=3388659 RepID=UPI00398B933F
MTETTTAAAGPPGYLYPGGGNDSGNESTKKEAATGLRRPERPDRFPLAAISHTEGAGRAGGCSTTDSAAPRHAAAQRLLRHRRRALAACSAWLRSAPRDQPSGVVAAQRPVLARMGSRVGGRGVRPRAPFDPAARAAVAAATARPAHWSDRVGRALPAVRAMARRGETVEAIAAATRLPVAVVEAEVAAVASQAGRGEQEHDDEYCDRKRHDDEHDGTATEASCEASEGDVA